jgi:hypothetical protein
MYSIKAPRHIDQAKTNGRKLISQFSVPPLLQYEFLKVYSQGVKTERNLNCNRALRRCRKICETGNIQPMK